MEKEKVPANKNNDYLIDANSTGDYHVQFTERTATTDPNKFEDAVKVQTFSIQGFEGFKKHKSHFQNFLDIKILHDPTLKSEKAEGTTEPEPGKPGRKKSV